MLPLPAKPAFSPTSTYWLAARDIYQTMRRLGAQNPLAIAALANADMESAFRPLVVGDDGTAFNVWQWHWNPRGARILQGYGVDVRTETSLIKLTQALYWEMTAVVAYQPALAEMKAALTAEEAAGVFCSAIEGAGAADAKQRRMADAAWWSKAIADHAEFFAIPPDP
jgi:hypothetical protein